MLDQNVNMNSVEAGGFMKTLVLYGIVHPSMSMKWSCAQLDFIQGLIVQKQMWVKLS
jgi:hypothetical protein